MYWIATSIVVERVATESVATLFEHCGKNGFIEEEREDGLVAVDFFYETEDVSNQPAVWEMEVQHKLMQAGITPYSVRTEILQLEDWLTGWKDTAEAITLLPDLVVAPSWKPMPVAKDGQHVVSYNSDLAFGTGAHETTFCCAQLMALYGCQAKEILDIGTGTGILLLVANHIAPFAKLVGIDIDGPSVVQARENCVANGVSATIIEGDLASDYDGKADLIVANLTVDPLQILLPVIADKLAPGGILIISGIVDERLGELAIEDHWQVVEHMHKRNWHTFALRPLAH